MAQMSGNERSFGFRGSGGSFSGSGSSSGFGSAPSQAPSFRDFLNKPAPVYAPFNASQGAPQQQAPQYQAPAGGYAQGGYNMQPTYPGGGGGGGGQQAAAPAPQRRTQDDFANQFRGNDGGLAIADSTFSDQKSMYANVLKKYIEDYSRQNETLGRDATTASEGIARNRENGLNGQAEDFFARGIGNSGMFATEQDKARDQYSRQDQNVQDSLRDSRADLDFRKAKFEGENGENGSNLQSARRDAYMRLALGQSLV